jgi:YesN/AraC family two-component response regulator
MAIYEAIESRLSGLLSESSDTGLQTELERLRQAAAASGIAPDDFTEMLYALATGIYRELHSLDPGTPVVPASSFHQRLRESPSASSAIARVMCLFRDAAHTLNDRVARDRVPAVTRARAYIAKNYARMLSLDEVAEACSVNPSYLSRVFHQTTGYTFTDYVNRLRVDRAKELLVARPTAFIYEIAHELGFEDSAYFSRLFRELSGTTPGTWRKVRGSGLTEDA